MLENIVKEQLLKLKELKSMLFVLQKAVQNEVDQLEFKDIDNYLEIALNTASIMINDTKNIITDIEPN